MSSINSIVYLDLQYDNIAYAHIKQGDYDKRYITAYIFNGGVPYDLSDNSVAFIKVEKPNGKYIINDATVDALNNKVQVKVSQEMVEYSGVLKAEISITDGNESATTIHFFIGVDEYVADGNKLESVNEYQTLLKMMEEVKDLKNELDDFKAITSKEIKSYFP